MKKRLLTLTISLLVSISSFCQLIDDDITIITKGLSQEYASRFKNIENKASLVSILNELSVTRDIAPIKIIVTYENGVGNIIAEINYNLEKIFANPDYRNRNEDASRFVISGKGISVFLQHQIFLALNVYKGAVASKDYMTYKDVINFESTVKCKKANGDFINFYAHNHYNSYQLYDFYKNVHIIIAGNIYNVEASNTKALNEMKFFMVGRSIGLDGNKTDAFYFCKFFGSYVKSVDSQF